jgi:SPP1 family predicted phage head-tail adaptor
VTIEKPVVTPDEYGVGAPPAWEPVETVWAGVRPLKASESLRGQQSGMETTYVVTMRYNPRVTPDRRLNWGGHFLYVNGIIDTDGRGTEMQVGCREQEAAGG